MERPSERRAAARTAVVWEALQQRLEVLGSSPARVVDVGGGTGGFAVRLAALGHDVTVVDPSPDALAGLARRAAEAEIAGRLAGVQGDLATLPGLVPSGGADLVLCHGVLGLLDDPAGGVAGLHEVLAEQGTLSLVVAQSHAAVLARAMSGAFSEARDLLAGAVEPEAPHVPRGERRFTEAQLRTLLHDGGLVVDRLQGVRVFSDLVPGALLDLHAGATAALLDLERLASDRAEYLPSPPPCTRSARGSRTGS